METNNLVLDIIVQALSYFAMFAIFSIFAIAIYMGYVDQQKKYKQRKKDFQDMSTKTGHKDLDEHLENEAKEFLQNVNL
jgi:hypothetical protein